LSDLAEQESRFPRCSGIVPACRGSPASSCSA